MHNTVNRFLSQSCLAILPALAFSTGLLHAQNTNVATWRNNNWRTGWNNTEVELTQETVVKNKFGKICSTKPGAIDGQIYAQPLVMTGTIPGHNHVVYVATMNDSVYFIDGDSSACDIIFHASLLKSNEKAVNCTLVGKGHCSAMNPLIGILGTPVIDPATNTMYLVAWLQSTAPKCQGELNNGNCFIYRFHALDITTGAEKFNGPVNIPPIIVEGATFTASKHLQRPGLLLLPNVESNGDSGVYIAFSTMDGAGQVGINLPKGWIFRYDAGDLSVPPVAWVSTPTGQGGGVWLSGAGLAAGVDQPGGQTYLYVATGDGTFDAESGGSNYGDSLVKLTTD